MKIYRTGVIGTGFIGVAHVETLRRLGNVEVVAICDKFNAAEKAEELFVKEHYKDYKLMIDECGLDFVHICTPNNTHYEIAKYALSHNVNVLLEKPMAFSTEEARELFEISEHKNLICAINFHNRLYPAAVFMKDYISSLKLGNIMSVNGMYVQDWLLFENDYSWRLNKKESGNTRAVADIGSHWLDLIQYVTNLNIVEVFADFKTVYPSRKKIKGQQLAFSKNSEGAEYEDINIDTEDMASILFRLENGAMGNLFISQVAAGRKNTIDVLISGTKASLTWQLENNEKVIIGKRDEPSEIVLKDALIMASAINQMDYPSGHTEGFADAFKQVFKEVYYQPATKHYATFKDGYDIMLLADKIFESSQLQQWVSVKGVHNEDWIT